jgi:NAD(P)-dependent dehydrogenase (short-subunit alcohol dehydrogenase family)
MTMLRVARSILPGMVARRSGCIVNMGSTAGIVGDQLLSVYSAAKGAVHSFTKVLAKVLAKEVGDSGVRVNAVEPYATLPLDDRNSVRFGGGWPSARVRPILWLRTSVYDSPDRGADPAARTEGALTTPCRRSEGPVLGGGPTRASDPTATFERSASGQTAVRLRFG